MLRAHLRQIPGLNLATQNNMADKDGVQKKARYDDLSEAVGGMRSGDLLWVADLTVLADNRDELIRVLNRLSTAKYPVGIHEGRTGRVSLPPHDGAHMAIEALARWSSANKRFGVHTPEEAGEIGGKVAARRRRKQKLPKSEAAKYWYDKALADLDTDAIVAKIKEVGRAAGFKSDWSKDALYRALGKRGVFAGRKMKPRK